MKRIWYLGEVIGILHLQCCVLVWRGKKKAKQTNKKQQNLNNPLTHPKQKTLTKPNLQWFLGILINKPWQIVFKVLSTIRSENKN